MKIDNIHIKNYRCFCNLDIPLEDHLTLFVGKNGAGKSAILDAIAVAASTFLCGIDGGSCRNILKGDARYEFYEIGEVIDAQPQFPVLITATGECGGQEVYWMRSLSSSSGKTTMKDARALIEIAEQMQSQVMAGDTETTLPILSYYGTGRLYAQKKEKRDLLNLLKFNRQAGYLDCMEAESNEKMMLNWFQTMTLKSLQNQQKTGKIEKIPQLMAVEQAVCKCFQKINGCKDAEVSFDLDTHRIMIGYEDKSGSKSRFALNEMSDGYKNTLSMIGDIAYRMAVLNPQLGKEVLAKTPGIVLIDEIDLHLHPEWQQTILEDLQSIFPQVQFLVTSHAPSVIHSVKRENIRILDRGEIFVPAEQTYGRDANSILREVMQVWERPEEIRQMLTSFYQTIDKGDVGNAEDLLRQIEELVGDSDPEISSAKVTLDFEKMRGEWM